MKTYKLILLFIMLVAGVVCIAYDKGFRINGGMAKVIREGDKNPLGIKPQNVFFLSIRNKGGSFSIERANGDAVSPSTSGFFNTINPKWILIDPEGAVANQNLISGLIDKLTNLRIQGVISKQERENSGANGLESYGLVNPELTVVVSDSIEHVLEFGELNFLSGRRYLKIKGDDNIYLVDSFLFNDFDLLVGQVRESTPYQVDINSVTEVSAVLGMVAKTSVRLVKESDDEWYVEPDGEANKRFVADKAVVEKSLESALNFTVGMFVDQAMSEKEFQLLNLSPADLALEVVVTGSANQKNTTTKLPKILFGQAVIAQYGDEMEVWDPEFGKKEGDLQKAYFTKLETSPHVYKLSSMVYRPFAGDSEFFRDRKPFRAIHKDIVHSVEIVSQTSSTYSKDDPKWADMHIDALLEKIFDFQVIAYIEDTVESATKGSETEIILYGTEKTKIASLVIKGSVGSKKTASAEDAPRYVAVYNSVGAKPLYAIASSSVIGDVMNGL